MKETTDKEVLTTILNTHVEIMRAMLKRVVILEAQMEVVLDTLTKIVIKSK